MTHELVITRDLRIRGNDVLCVHQQWSKQMSHYCELQRPVDCNTDYANGILTGMEAAARAGNDHGRARVIACKWLAVFMRGGELAYNWQGGYPTNIVSREAALSVLARA